MCLSSSGELATYGAVSKRLQLSRENAGNFDQKEILKNLSATIVWKSASTEQRAKSAFLDESANSTKHIEKTADEHYFVQNMETSAMIGTTAISQFFSWSCK